MWGKHWLYHARLRAFELDLEGRAVNEGRAKRRASQQQKKNMQKQSLRSKGSQVGVVPRNALTSGQRAGACWIYPVWPVSSSSGHSPAVHEWLPDLEKLEAEEYQKHEFRQSSVQENYRRRGGGWAAHREDCSDWPCLSSSKYSLLEGFLPSFLSSLPLSLPPSFRHLSRTSHVPGIVLGPGDTEMLGQVVGVEGYQNNLVPRSSSWSKEACLCAEQGFRTCSLER